MKKVLIINGHQYYDVVARGELTQKYIDKATKFFLDNGFEVKHTNIENGYKTEEECEKFEWADAVLFQYPVYWMGIPWITKKYFDKIGKKNNLVLIGTLKRDKRFMNIIISKSRCFKLY